jgi:hypothetical protein
MTRITAAISLSALLAAGCASSSSTASGPPNGAAAAEAAKAVLSVEPWEFDRNPGSVVRTNHYRIYTTSQRSVITQRLADYLERSIEHYTTAITPLPEPDTKLDVYLMENRAQWANLTRRLLGDNADNPLAIGRGGYATRGIGVYYDIGLYDTLAIAGHEGWHQYTQRVFKDHLPIYLEEGIATWMEGHRWIDQKPMFTPWANVNRHDQLRAAAADGRLLSLTELVEVNASNIQQISPTALLDYYAQVWALSHYLQTDELSPGTEQLLVDAAAGALWPTVMRETSQNEAVKAFRSRTGPEVLITYYDVPLEELEAGYAAFVERLIAPGSRERIVNNWPPL